MQTSSTQPALRDAIRNAVRIAQLLAEYHKPPAPWEEVKHKYTRWDSDELQYGVVPVWKLRLRAPRHRSEEEAADFWVWVDRTQIEGRYDEPILCAAFGASGRHAAHLEAVARSEGISAKTYGYQHRARVYGFHGEPVIEIPSNDARYVTCYRPAGDLDIDEAVREFGAFFNGCSPVRINGTDL